MTLTQVLRNFYVSSSFKKNPQQHNKIPVVDNKMNVSKLSDLNVSDWLLYDTDGKWPRKWQEGQEI